MFVASVMGGLAFRLEPAIFDWLCKTMRLCG